MLLPMNEASMLYAVESMCATAMPVVPNTVEMAKAYRKYFNPIFFIILL